MSRERPLIDSHCHLQSLAPDKRETALDEARERGVSGFLVPATRLDEAEEILDLCRRHDDVWCALGVHPHDAASWRPGDDRRLAELLREPSVLAVGECGLDFHYDNSPRGTQLAVFRRQMDLALEADLPVVVHNRDSDEVMLEAVLRDELAGLRADYHSFAGSLEMARALIRRDFYLGVTGMVTFKRADNIREILAEIPADRLLIETDTPYLAPVPYRGKPNRPAYVVEVAEKVAELGDESVEQVARRTSENFLRLFGPLVPGRESAELAGNQG
ncbi:MAG: TatD family hydrolase [Thermoanaerobaculia bacterium]